MQLNQAADKVKVNFQRICHTVTDSTRPQILGVFSTETKRVTDLSLYACLSSFAFNKSSVWQTTIYGTSRLAKGTYICSAYIHCWLIASDDVPIFPDCWTNLITFPIRHLVIFCRWLNVSLSPPLRISSHTVMYGVVWSKNQKMCATYRSHYRPFIRWSCFLGYESTYSKQANQVPLPRLLGCSAIWAPQCPQVCSWHEHTRSTAGRYPVLAPIVYCQLRQVFNFSFDVYITLWRITLFVNLYISMAIRGTGCRSFKLVGLPRLPG